MTETLEPVTKEEAGADGRAGGSRRTGPAAAGAGLSLTGSDGLLKQLTKLVIETALDQELTEHLGHEEHRRGERERQRPHWVPGRRR
jgi:putative transposase